MLENTKGKKEKKEMLNLQERIEKANQIAFEITESFKEKNPIKISAGDSIRYIEVERNETKVLTFVVHIKIRLRWNDDNNPCLGGKMFIYVDIDSNLDGMATLGKSKLQLTLKKGEN